MIVYVDLIILSNFLLDYSLITYTGIITNEKVKIWRIILASLFAVSSLLLFFVNIEWLFFLLRFIWGLVIIFIAFKYINITKYLKNLFIFYFLNFITAGIIISYDFHFFNNSILVDFNNSTTWYLLIISFIFANILTYIYKVIEVKNARIKTSILDVNFRFLNHEYHAKGLIDTGNLVTSRNDNLPIIFIDKDIISEEVNEVYLLKNNVKFTYINYKTIKNRYITLAFKPEFFGIVIDNKLHEKDVYIAIVNNIKSKDQSFNVILNSNILI